MPENAAPPGRTRRLSIDGLGLAVLDYGRPGGPAGPPMLLLHGGMAHARWWDFVAPLLAAEAHPWALDRRGHGDSDWTVPERYDWERHLRDIEEACAMLDPGPWVVVGHSQGGILAVDVLDRGRLPAAGLVLLDVPLHLATTSMRRTGESLAKIPQMRWPSLEQAVRAFRPFPGDHRIPPGRLEYIARNSFKPSGDGGWVSKFHWKSFRRASPDAPAPHVDFPDRLRRVAVPTLCVRAGESTILPPGDLADMAGRIPDARALEIPATSHQLHVEQPEAVAGAVLDFARGLRRS